MFMPHASAKPMYHQGRAFISSILKIPSVGSRLNSALKIPRTRSPWSSRSREAIAGPTSSIGTLIVQVLFPKSGGFIRILRLPKTARMLPLRSTKPSMK